MDRHTEPAKNRRRKSLREVRYPNRWRASFLENSVNKDPGCALYPAPWRQAIEITDDFLSLIHHDDSCPGPSGGGVGDGQARKAT
jgi:hypothetical protein